MKRERGANEQFTSFPGMSNERARALLKERAREEMKTNGAGRIRMRSAKTGRAEVPANPTKPAKRWA